MSFTPYDHTTDPTAFLVLDDRSVFSTSGSQVTGVSNVSAAGSAYPAVADTGTVTLSTAAGGYKALVFDGSSTLKVPTSTGFDAQFTNTGNTGGCGLFVVFDAADGQQGFILSKQSNAGNQGGVQLALFSGTNGYVQRFGTAQCWRPYHGGLATGCVANEQGTDRTNNPGEAPGGNYANYRDGTTVYYNGTPSGKFTTWPNLAASAGNDFKIGAWYVVNFTGKVRAVVCWNRAPKPHEVLAVDRYYRARYAMPEVLTNQPFALVAESNSESTNPQGYGEPGPFDRAATLLGISTNADFMLGQAARSGNDIVHDYPTWTAPLVAYLRSLGLTTAVHLWELINDTYGGFAAASYVNYWNLVKASGAKFSAGTVFARSTITPSFGGSSLNPICAANNQVVADAAAYGYTASLLGFDPQLRAYNAAYFSDGVHWQSPAVAIGAPYFAAAIKASLATSNHTGAATRNRWFPGLARGQTGRRR